MKAKQLAKMMIMHFEMEVEEMDQKIANLDEMRRIYTEKRNMLINSIQEIEQSTDE